MNYSKLKFQIIKIIQYINSERLHKSQKIMNNRLIQIRAIMKIYYFILYKINKNKIRNALLELKHQRLIKNFTEKIKINKRNRYIKKKRKCIDYLKNKNIRQSKINIMKLIKIINFISFVKNIYKKKPIIIIHAGHKFLKDESTGKYNRLVKTRQFSLEDIQDWGKNKKIQKNRRIFKKNEELKNRQLMENKFYNSLIESYPEEIKDLLLEIN